MKANERQANDNVEHPCYCVVCCYSIENDECYKDLLRHGPKLAHTEKALLDTSYSNKLDQIKTNEVVFMPEQMHTQWAACRQLTVRQCGEF